MTENMYVSQKNPVRSRDTKIIVCWVIIIFLVIANVFALNYLQAKKAKANSLTAGNQAKASTVSPTQTVTTTPFTSVTPSTGKEVFVSFDTGEIQLGTIGSEIKVNLLVNSGENLITGGGITVQYPAALTFNHDKTKAQASNADPLCKKLPQVLSLSDSAQTIRMTKVSVETDSNLPKSGFCFATLFFTVNSQTVSTNDEIAFGGRINEIKDWDFVGTGGSRYTVKTGSPVKLLSSTSGTPTPGSDCPEKVNGDANCDRKVTNDDFMIYLVEYLAQTQNVLDIQTAKADFNNDKSVDVKDFDILIRNLPGTPQPTISVTTTPTPSITVTVSPVLTITATPSIKITPSKCACMDK